MQKNTFLKKLCGPYLWMWLNRIKTTEPLRGDRFTANSPGVPGTYLINLEGWKVELTLEPPNGFECGIPGLEAQHRNH